MKRLLAFLALLLLLAGYIISTVPALTEKVLESGYINDIVMRGDLYKKSRLSSFNKLREICDHPAPKAPAHRKKLRFFVIGDSFTMHLPGESFMSDGYTFTHWSDQTTGTIDSSYTNVLLIESIERVIREYFAQHENKNIVVKRAGKYELQKNKDYEMTQQEKLYRSLFGKQIIETDLEFVMFENPITRPLKELKADINYRFFGRTDNSVVLSKMIPDMLYYRQTVASELFTSSFNTVSDQEVWGMVENMNVIDSQYRAMGFDKVIYSIIPNKVSICEPGSNYNHLITRIQDSKNRRFNIIDAYGMLSTIGCRAYDGNDTHWNCKGRDAWLDSVNASIKEIEGRADR